MGDVVYTIGHSRHSKEKLIELLARHEITAVADVRSQPYSRRNPQFTLDTLRADLKVARIAYVFLGRELAARTENRSGYVGDTMPFHYLGPAKGDVQQTA